MSKKIFLLIGFCFLLIVSKAQTPKKFTADPVLFPKEMQTFLETGIEKEAKKLMERFNEVWVANKFTPEQQTLIYQFSNDMLRKHMKPFPDFSNYINALIGFTEGSQSNESFKNWHLALEKGLGSSPKRLSDFIENCYSILAHNAIYESSAVRWVPSNNKFRFEYDSLPKIVFDNFDLVCYSKNDSSVIYNTSGAYYPNSKTFFGKGGKVYWTRAGLVQGEASADVRNYSIDVKGSDFECDSVTFFYPKYFSKPLFGKYQDKILANVTTENASYPRFISYDKSLEISNLVKDAQYIGGFALQGNKMIGGGSDEADATLIYFRNSKPFLKATAKGFVVRPERIASESAAITIFWNNDSIYHPGVNFKYVNADKKVTLFRDTRGAQQAPYFDTWHKMDLYFDELTWKLDSPTIDLKMTAGLGESKLVFESDQYYRQQRFEKIQGIAEESPLYTIKKFARKYNTSEVYTLDLAKEMRMEESQVRSLLLFLSNQGFLSYDFKEDKAIIKDKLYYYLDARIMKTDYDAIVIQSQIEKEANATINLLNFDIKMRGVGGVMLSDSNNVYMMPDNQELILKKNRELEFNGKVHASRMEFEGTGFNFLYDDFKVKMSSIKKMRLAIPTDSLDNKGEVVLRWVTSNLSNLKGAMIIDSTLNKSGLKPCWPYPIFTSDGEGYVYYDDPSIYGGSYDRQSFYFKLDPFTIDSAGLLTASNIALAGTFVSSIFPDSREVLTVQPDYSLGFVKETGAAGLQAYGGKGTFTNKLRLSNKGLQGEGTINYITSTTKSKDILFFPDSTLAQADDFFIEKKNIGSAEYPPVEAHDVVVSWHPKKDYLDAVKKDKDFELYDKQVALDGNLRLSPAGLGGYGTAAFFSAQLLSSDFRFKQSTFGADTSEFRLIGDTLLSEYVINAKNFNSTIDLAKKTGDFRSNAGNSKIDFPVNQYICFIDKFKWFIEPRELEFNSDIVQQNGNTGAKYISTNALQDSLYFFSPSARYNLNDYLIKAQKVKEILVADAQILPDSGKVTVEKFAKIQTLTNAIVIANTTTKYHNVVNASIDIDGRKRYSGTGDYEYTDQAKVKHLIHLDRIAIDTAQQTYATGEIADTSNFLLAPSTPFKGKVRINASKVALYFDGYAQVQHQCEKIERNWFSFSGDIDPQGVNIPVNSPVNESREKLTAGFYFTNDSTGMYATFLSPKRKASDVELVSANGILSYDVAKKEYYISPKELRKDTSNNSIVLSDQKCVITAEGKLNMNVNFGQFKTASMGKVISDMQYDSLKLQTLMDLDFIFNEKALNMMSDVMLSYSNLKTVDETNPVFQNAMLNYLGKEKWDKVNGELSQSGTIKRPPEELKHAIFLNQLNLVWNAGTQSLRSVGPIGIGFVNKVPVSRLMKGYCEIIRKKSGGDSFNIYFEIDNNTWYFFSFARNVMQAISSDPNFNDEILKEKDEKRITKGKDALPDYQYMLSTERKKSEFVKRMLEE